MVLSDHCTVKTAFGYFRAGEIGKVPAAQLIDVARATAGNRAENPRIPSE